MMKMTASDSKLSGQLIRVDDITSTKEIGYYLQRYMDMHGKPPEVLVVNDKVEQVGLPEKFEGLGVQVLKRQYMYHAQLIIVGVLV